MNIERKRRRSRRGRKKKRKRWWWYNNEKKEILTGRIANDREKSVSCKAKGSYV